MFEKRYEFTAKEIERLRVPNLIGICGRSCVGKSTLARQLALHDGRYKIRSIGTEVAADVALALHTSVDVIRENAGRYGGLLGETETAMRWLQGEAYYVYRVLASAMQAHFDHLIIDDLMFPLEVHAACQAGDRTHTVRLAASDLVVKQRYYQQHGLPPDPMWLRTPANTALLPHAMLIRDEAMDFDQVIVTDNTDPLQVATWVENMLAINNFDFHHPALASWEAQVPQALRIGPSQDEPPMLTEYGRKLA